MGGPGQESNRRELGRKRLASQQLLARKRQILRLIALPILGTKVLQSHVHRAEPFGQNDRTAWAGSRLYAEPAKSTSQATTTRHWYRFRRGDGCDRCQTGRNDERQQPSRRTDGPQDEHSRTHCTAVSDCMNAI